MIHASMRTSTSSGTSPNPFCRLLEGRLIEGVPANANNGGESAGNFGRMTSVNDVPTTRSLAPLIKAAMQLNADGVVVPRKKVAKPEPDIPPELQAALAENRKAKAAFEKFPPSHRREYVEWIVEANGRRRGPGAWRRPSRG